MKTIYFFLIIFISIMIDMFSKWFFHGPFQNMFLHGDLYGYFPIFGELFGIKLIYNTGIAFGLPITGFFLQVLTLAIFAILCYYYIKHEKPKKSPLIDIAFALIFAGAISHTYERIFIGHVIDFFSLKNFAIFNFADVFISLGAIFTLFFYFFYERK